MEIGRNSQSCVYTNWKTYFIAIIRFSMESTYFLAIIRFSMESFTLKRLNTTIVDPATIEPFSVFPLEFQYIRAGDRDIKEKWLYMLTWRGAICFSQEQFIGIGKASPLPRFLLYPLTSSRLPAFSIFICSFRKWQTIKLQLEKHRLINLF